MNNEFIRAIWVELLGASPALAGQASLSLAFERLAQLEISDIYLQVYRAGQSWFPSSVADDRPWKELAQGGFDPISEALALAKRFGIRVHAWINVFNLSINAIAPLLRKYSSSILLSDNRGLNVSAYSEDLRPTWPGDIQKIMGQTFQLDAPKLWLDPAQDCVQQYLKELVVELFQKYPSLNGLHLDFFRYPYALPIKPSSRIPGGIDFGYGKDSIGKFECAHQLEAAFLCGADGELTPVSDEISLQWDRWRRAQVTQYLPLFRSCMTPDQILSVAVLAWSDRAYFSAYQNWRQWLSESLVDYVCPMAYTADDELFGYLIKQALAFQSAKSKVLPGIGAYLLKSADQLEIQKNLCRQFGASGAAIFSYSNIFK